jgi:hypothetical protein
MWSLFKRVKATAKINEIATGAETKSVAAVARTIEARRCRPRVGLTEAATYLATPFAISAFIDGISNPMMIEQVAGATFVMVVAMRFARLRYELGLTQAAAQTPEIDKTVVSPLIELMSSSRPYLRKMAKLHLRRVLLSLSERDRSLLLPGDMTGLAQYLTPRNAWRETELVTGILHACCELGDAEVHPWLIRLASCRAFTPRQATVRDLARVAVYRVEQRLASPASTDDLAQLSESSLQPVHLQIEAEKPAELTAEDRQAAEQALADLGLDKLTHPSLRLPFYIAAWIIIIPYTLIMTVIALSNRDWVSALIFGVLAGLATQLRRFVMTSQHLLLVGRLAAIDDLRIVGQLATALNWPNESVRMIVTEALAQHLPKLKASDSSLLNTEQRDSIYRMLKMSNASTYFSFIMATLAALEQVGDYAALPYVRELAETVPASGTQRKVCEAAQRCLPFLEARADQTSMSQTLLRGSSLTPAGQEALLRPASRSTDDGAEVLLRPGA